MRLINHWAVMMATVGDKDVIADGALYETEDEALTHARFLAANGETAVAVKIIPVAWYRARVGVGL